MAVLAPVKQGKAGRAVEQRLLGDGQVGRQLKAMAEVLAQLLAAAHPPVLASPTTAGIANATSSA